ncbi:intraflagellar transport protein 25 homolog [Babylonia areolata]|uniref:intraflagellar transport protein 25 homolog n=1 Tax=Babylonia areolata TaxID=304850 RepID=UPI003FD20EE2
MFDVALANGGAQIILSTSSDDAHPPEDMIDGKEETFWTTTGLFPQEVVIRFQALTSINKVQLACCNVKDVVLETSENENSDSFEPMAEKELDKLDNQVQTEDFSGGERKAHCLRMVIKSGHDHFVAVYSLKVDGKAIHG